MRECADSGDEVFVVWGGVYVLVHRGDNGCESMCVCMCVRMYTGCVFVCLCVCVFVCVYFCISVFVSVVCQLCVCRVHVVCMRVQICGTPSYFYTEIALDCTYTHA